MKKLYIIKTGTTFPATLEQFGDFDKWTTEALGDIAVETAVVDAEHGAPLPTADQCAGVAVTGSHSMVTDDLPWSVKLEEWLRTLLDAEVPVFGICYGHQLLARAAGGEVGYHPRGKEVGTVEIRLLESCAGDLLFKHLPPAFAVHATHAQSVLKLPEQAVLLAQNSYEPHHAFRIGPVAWGVQFHPEYDPAIMRSYIEHQKEVLEQAGRDVSGLVAAVKETPVATDLYRSFGRLVAERLKTIETP